MSEDVNDTTPPLGQNCGLAPVPHEIIARTYARKFVSTDIGSFHSKFNEVFSRRSNPQHIEHVLPKTLTGILGLADRISHFRRSSNSFIVVDPAETLGSPGRVVIFSESTAAESKIEVLPAAQERLSGHASLTEKVYAVIKEEAKRADIRPRITVRPSWSHESEDQTGVVIDVEITGDSRQRFDLWDAISAKLDSLLDTQPKREQLFLIDNISVVVVEGSR